jgi:hypothetical protein
MLHVSSRLPEGSKFHVVLAHLLKTSLLLGLFRCLALQPPGGVSAIQSFLGAHVGFDLGGNGSRVRLFHHSLIEVRNKF